MLFSRVVRENHGGFDSNAKRVLQVARQRPGNSLQLKQLVSGLRSYARKDERKFIYLAAGGITDNLGLPPFQEGIDVAGSAIDSGSFSSALEQTVNAVVDIQLHRSNTTTLKLFGRSMKRWAVELFTPEQPVAPDFVPVEL